MRKVTADLKMIMKPLKEDAARFISTFLIVGVGFTLGAYLSEGESAFERVFSALVGSDPLYKRMLYAAFFLGLFFELTFSFLHSYFGWPIDFLISIAQQLRGLLETVALLLAGTCITGTVIFYSDSEIGKASAMLASSFFFLIFYAGLLCATEYMKEKLSSLKVNGDRLAAKENKQQ